ncbi:MAG: epoxyqueuosine reductase QueH [bacterium]
MKPQLLLHVCCGPCATEALRRLAGEYAVIGCFANPNIAPEEEFLRRAAAAEQLAAAWHVPFEVLPCDHGAFLSAVRGLEAEPEGGRRCDICYRLRLGAAAERALAYGCTHLATTLTVGPRKPALAINPIGHDVCRKRGLEFVAGDWKKQDGFRRSVARARELGLYRQHYCGCEFSLPPEE